MGKEKDKIERVREFLSDLEDVIAGIQIEREKDKEILGFHPLSIRDLEEINKKIYRLRMEIEFLY